ncbi:hypothetical protein L484_000951 [Morus notabilis]|uniref:Uncharacterized protein n=1 Tax=Morus notabilis TaxID=981085 RepID=W9T1Q0_9ROSA|nr:hypothetical protein L484_000951 [Morus notabilis]
MFLVEGRVHTLAIAANLVVLALLPALAAVMAVSHHIDTLLLATSRPGAALGATNPREPLARHPPSVLPWREK